MQSCFCVSEMDSTNKPPSPMAAAASDKRKFRNCTNCTNRMPSIDFDAHTLCIGCRRKVCDMSVHCDECRDWSDSYRSAFVKYNRTLKAKRDLKGRRKARLSAAQSQSDQSVYDTDTECLLLPFTINDESVPGSPPQRLAYRTFYMPQVTVLASSLRYLQSPQVQSNSMVLTK